jgi:hypothetical protein
MLGRVEPLAAIFEFVEEIALARPLLIPECS